MREVLQSLRSGTIEVAEVPRPNVGESHLLIHTSHTLISSGTERMLVQFGRAGLINKARQQPEKVKMVLDKIKTDGLLPTLDAIKNKLDQPLPLGYCNVGVVAQVGRRVSGFEIGDLVASNGNHAEVVNVPATLCARIPEGVSPDQAAFTVVGAIALQGIRLLQPSLGEAVVVTGLGLVGLLAVQLLRANGCRVLGLDFDPAKLAFARQFGAETVNLSAGEDPISAANAFSRGRGVDAVLIAASTDSNEPIHQAALMCRPRGRVVLVGVAGLHLSRDDFYKKEISFQVSASYGPGRYDPTYEEKGQDYPIGYVRWTAQRNFEAVLDMLASRSLNTVGMVTHRFPIVEAQRAYALLSNGEPSLGILLDYPGSTVERAGQTIAVSVPSAAPPNSTRPVVAFIGAGNYASSVLIPAFRNGGAQLHSVACNTGVSGLHAARKFGFAHTTTDTASLFHDPTITTVVITTRHNSHARLVVEALKAGKNVFVEKPLCLTLSELAEIEAVMVRLAPAPRLMVGFNRRFAAHTTQIKQLLGTVRGPKSFVMTVNAGSLPREHWTQDHEIGGGRILGEGCHFIDLLRFLAGVPIAKWHVLLMDVPTRDTACLQLRFADGSIGTVNYFSNGNKALPKERLEVFCDGRVLQLDNFRKLTAFGWRGFKPLSLWRQDKGQATCAAAFLKSVEDGTPCPIPFDELREVSRVTIEMANAT